jgi:hypothetical protein
MSTNRVAIIGYGAVGRHMERLFPDALVYDTPLVLGRRLTSIGVNTQADAVVADDRPDRTSVDCGRRHHGAPKAGHR